MQFEAIKQSTVHADTFKYIQDCFIQDIQNKDGFWSDWTADDSWFVETPSLKLSN